MKMDYRDSTECKNWEIKGHDGHFEICFKSLKDKRSQVTCLLPLSKGKRKRGDEGKRERCRGFWISFSR